MLLAGKRLAECRKKRDLSQEELVEKIMLLPENNGKERNEKQISFIETGKRSISLEYARLLSKVLNCRVEYLLLEDDFETESDRIQDIIGQHTDAVSMIMQIALLNGFEVSKQMIDTELKHIRFPSDLTDDELLKRANESPGVPYVWISSKDGKKRRMEYADFCDMIGEIEDYIVFRFSNRLNGPRAFRK